MTSLWDQRSNGGLIPLAEIPRTRTVSSWPELQGAELRVIDLGSSIQNHTTSATLVRKAPVPLTDSDRAALAKPSDPLTKSALATHNSAWSAPDRREYATMATISTMNSMPAKQAPYSHRCTINNQPPSSSVGQNNAAATTVVALPHLLPTHPEAREPRHRRLREFLMLMKGLMF